jgi:hypothetical protein
MTILFLKHLIRLTFINFTFQTNTSNQVNNYVDIDNDIELIEDKIFFNLVDTKLNKTKVLLREYRKKIQKFLIDLPENKTYNENAKYYLKLRKKTFSLLDTIEKDVQSAKNILFDIKKKFDILVAVEEKLIELEILVNKVFNFVKGLSKTTIDRSKMQDKVYLKNFIRSIDLSDQVKRDDIKILKWSLRIILREKENEIKEKFTSYDYIIKNSEDNQKDYNSKKAHVFSILKYLEAVVLSEHNFNLSEVKIFFPELKEIEQIMLYISTKLIKD